MLTVENIEKDLRDADGADAPAPSDAQTTTGLKRKSQTPDAAHTNTAAERKALDEFASLISDKPRQGVTRYRLIITEERHDKIDMLFDQEIPPMESGDGLAVSNRPTLDAMVWLPLRLGRRQGFRRGTALRRNTPRRADLRRWRGGGQTLRRGVANTARTIRLPVHAHDLLKQIDKARGMLESKLGRPPTLDELSVEVGHPPAKIEEILASARIAKSLDDGLSDDGDMTLGDLAESSRMNHIMREKSARFRKKRRFLPNLRQDPELRAAFGRRGGGSAATTRPASRRWFAARPGCSWRRRSWCCRSVGLC